MSSQQLVNPATEEVLGSVQHTEVADVDDAVQRARAAQRRWARLSPAERAAGLRAFAAMVDAHRDEPAQLEVVNSGHPIASAEWEAGAVRDVLQFYAASPERLSGKQIPVAGGIDVTFNEPIGVVGVDFWRNCRVIRWATPLASVGRIGGRVRTALDASAVTRAWCIAAARALTA